MYNVYMYNVYSTLYDVLADLTHLEFVRDINMEAFQ